MGTELPLGMHYLRVLSGVGSLDKSMRGSSHSYTQFGHWLSSWNVLCHLSLSHIHKQGKLTKIKLKNKWQQTLTLFVLTEETWKHLNHHIRHPHQPCCLHCRSCFSSLWDYTSGITRNNPSLHTGLQTRFREWGIRDSRLIYSILKTHPSSLSSYKNALAKLEIDREHSALSGF